MALDAVRQYQGCFQAPDKPLLLQLLILGIFFGGWFSKVKARRWAIAQPSLHVCLCLPSRASLNCSEMSSTSRKNEPTLQGRLLSCLSRSLIGPPQCMQMGTGLPDYSVWSQSRPVVAIVQCWDMSSGTEKCII